MQLPINHNRPLMMHIDLNSCFASVEQQVNWHLRDKPIVVAAYTSPGGCVLSPSIEAKKLGIKVGMTVKQARLICKNIIVRDPDPELVRDVHIKFKKIFSDYSPIVIPKSIDEVVIDFTATPVLKTKTLIKIGFEIKQRLRNNVGDWLRCNIGIATNRFLAKLAAGLHKPDGLDIIDYNNLRQIYQQLNLIDLPGINVRYQARLNAATIFTPLQFLDASEQLLRKTVFKSIVGYHWYQRLRGLEVDNIEFDRKSFGQDYALGKKTSDQQMLARYLMKLCEKMGRRLRHSGYNAYGIHVSLVYDDWTYWHKSHKFSTPLYSTDELFTKALLIFNQQSEKKIVTKISVSCFALSPLTIQQPDLFDTIDRNRQLSMALDKINDRWGEFTIAPALMMNMDKLILDRIAFGSNPSRIDNH